MALKRNNMKKSAVEWLVEVVAKMGYVSTEVLEQAKEMEKEQIQNAYEEGYNRVVKVIEDATKINLNKD